MARGSALLSDAEGKSRPLLEDPEDNPLIAYLCYRNDRALQLAEELSLMAGRCGLYRDLPYVPLEITCCWIQAAQYLCQQPPYPKDALLPGLLRAMGRGDPPYTMLRELAPWVRSLWLIAARTIEQTGE